MLTKLMIPIADDIHSSIMFLIMPSGCKHGQLDHKVYNMIKGSKIHTRFEHNDIFSLKGNKKHGIWKFKQFIININLQMVYMRESERERERDQIENKCA